MGKLDIPEEKTVEAEAVDKILTEEQLGEDATCVTGQHEKNVYNLDAMAGDLDDDPEA